MTTESAALRLGTSLLVVLTLVGCSTSPDSTKTGVVTVITPRVCIALTDAQGECFPGADAGTAKVGDCVVFVYRIAEGVTALRSLTKVIASRHRADCAA